jgi:multidrug efflux system membrane fusion protein
MSPSSVRLRPRRIFGFGIAGLAISLTTLACSGTAAEGSAKGGGRGGRGRGGAPQPVVVARVTQKDVPVDIAAVGSVEASSTISVRSQVTGILERVAIHEGDFVKKGDLLFAIDERPLKALLEQADANLERDQALLEQSEAALARDAANAEYQQLTSERQVELVKQGIVSKDAGQQAKSQADASLALVKADKAAIRSATAQIKVEQAAVDNGKVQLDYCVIRSPIDGRMGDVTVKAGNLVTAQTTQLMTITQLQPIFVTFSIPALNVPVIKEHVNRGDKLLVVATPQDSEDRSADGKLTFWDNSVDPTTDTIKLKATFDNADRRLWPGQFARVSLRLSTLHNALIVPDRAVQTGQDGQYVFVVNQGQGGRSQDAVGAANGGGSSIMTVETRPVNVTQTVGDDAVIEKGLKLGEIVVAEGQLRLEQGTRVQITDTSGTPTGRGPSGARGSK